MSPEFAVPASWWFFFFLSSAKLKLQQKSFLKLLFFLEKKLKSKRIVCLPKEAALKGKGCWPPWGLRGMQICAPWWGLGGRRSPPGPKFQRLPRGFLDGSSRSLARLALLRPSLSGAINEVPRRDLPGPPSNSAAPPLAHANSSFLRLSLGLGGRGGPSWTRSPFCRSGRASFCPAAPRYRWPASGPAGAHAGLGPLRPPGQERPGDSTQPHKSSGRPPGRDFMNEKAVQPPSCAG